MQMRSNGGPRLGLVGNDSARGRERRRVPRYVAAGSGVAHFDASSDHAITGIELVDSSASGLGLLSPAWVDIGGRARVFLGDGPLPSRVGIVRRCEVVEGGDGPVVYRVGLDTGPAAINVA